MKILLALSMALFLATPAGAAKLLLDNGIILDIPPKGNTAPYNRFYNKNGMDLLGQWPGLAGAYERPLSDLDQSCGLGEYWLSYRHDWLDPEDECYVESNGLPPVGSPAWSD